MKRREVLHCEDEDGDRQRKGVCVGVEGREFSRMRARKVGGGMVMREEEGGEGRGFGLAGSGGWMVGEGEIQKSQDSG